MNRAVIAISLLISYSAFCFGEDLSTNTDSIDSRSREFTERQFTNREFTERQVIERQFIDRLFIEREIYYRFGEYVDDIYIIDLQSEDYINARIQIDSRYNLDIGRIIGNIAIGTGVILITAIAIPAIIPAMGPQISVIVAHITHASLASAAIGASVEGVITYIRTGGDTRATINNSITAASEGYKWGAIFASGAEISSVLIRASNANILPTRKSRYAVEIIDQNTGLKYFVEQRTGIKYVERIVLKNGELVKGEYFAEFNSLFDTRLPRNLLMVGDDDQFRYCMNKLREEIRNPRFANRFTTDQLRQIREGLEYYPTGLRWHHNEQTGIMQLVDSFIHANTPHTGGRSIWGGGSGARR